MKPVKRSRAFVLSILLSMTLLVAYAPFALAVDDMNATIDGVTDLIGGGTGGDTGTTTGGDTGGATGGDTGGTDAGGTTDTGGNTDTGDTGGTTYTDPATNYDYTGTDDYAANVTTTADTTADVATDTTAVAEGAAVASQPLAATYPATLDFSSLLGASDVTSSDAQTTGQASTMPAFAGLTGASTAGISNPTLATSKPASTLGSVLLVILIAGLMAAVTMLLLRLRREQLRKRRIEGIRREASMDFVQMTPFPEDIAMGTGMKDLMTPSGRHGKDDPFADIEKAEGELLGSSEPMGAHSKPSSSADVTAPGTPLVFGSHSRGITVLDRGEGVAGAHSSDTGLEGGEQRWTA